VFELGKEIKSKPVIVSIHGQANSGKTHVLRVLINKAHKMGFAVSGGQCEDLWAYEKSSDYIFVEDAVYTEQAENCARRIAGKGVDIRVLIHNSQIKEPVLYPGLILTDLYNEKYNLIIDNPNSQVKRL